MCQDIDRACIDLKCILITTRNIVSEICPDCRIEIICEWYEEEKNDSSEKEWYCQEKKQSAIMPHHIDKREHQKTNRDDCRNEVKNDKKRRERSKNCVKHTHSFSVNYLPPQTEKIYQWINNQTLSQK